VAEISTLRQIAANGEHKHQHWSIPCRH